MEYCGYQDVVSGTFIKSVKPEYISSVERAERNAALARAGVTCFRWKVIPKWRPWEKGGNLNG